MRTPINIFMADFSHDILSGNNTVPLNIGSIAAYNKLIYGDNINIKLFKSPSHLLNTIKSETPDILALSNYMWNRRLNFIIGNEVKKHFPETKIIMGGPGARTDKDGIKSFLNNNIYLDAYMLFEGEKPFANFLEKILENVDNSKAKSENNVFIDGQAIKGCAYIADNNLVYSVSDMISALDEIPSPYLSGLMDEFLTKTYIPIFESNRGCPNQCSFCNWGVSALRKIRKFSLDRLFEEMEYVGKKNPDLPLWLVADANFGILKRDIEIAKKMVEMKQKTPGLGKIKTYDSKTTPEISKIISNIINSDKSGDVERHLIAVQSFDPEVLDINRISSYDLSKIPATVKEFHKTHTEVTSCIISGLPGETFKSQIETLKKCFEADIDFLLLFELALLPGSPVESDVIREKYGLKGKFRMRKGSCGIYNDLLAIECEEVVVANAGMNEEEMLEIKLIHLIINICWNTTFFKPLFEYLMSASNINPLDIILKIISHKKKKYPIVDSFFKKYKMDVKGEKFDSSEEIHNLDKNEFEKIWKTGLYKPMYRYTALSIIDNKLFNEFCGLIHEVVTGLDGNDHIFENLILLSQELPVDIESIIEGKTCVDKEIKISKKLAEFLSGKESGKNRNTLKLFIPEGERIFFKNMLMKYEYNKDKLSAVEKFLESSFPIFSYNMKINEQEMRFYNL